MDEKEHTTHTFERTPLPEASAFVDRLAVKNATVAIDPNRCLSDAKTTLEKLGIDAPVIAMLERPRAGASQDTPQDRELILLLDTRHMPDNDNTPFVLFGLDGSLQNVQPNSSVSLIAGGRDQEAAAGIEASMMLDTTGPDEKLILRTSGEDSVIHITGFVEVPDVAADDTKASKVGMFATYTSKITQILDKGGDLGSRTPEAPHGFYERNGLKYPLIGHRSPTVRGGVQGAGDERRAEYMLVDDQSEMLKKVTSVFLETLAADRARMNVARLPERYILEHAASFVRVVLQYDNESTERINHRYDGARGQSDLIPLSQYVKERVGVCRQQALLTALLLEAVIDAGLLTGTVHVERNQDLATREAHAWTVLDKGNGEEEMVIDATNDVIEPRSLAIERGVWNYALYV